MPTAGAIESIEAAFRCRLPSDYRQFLLSEQSFEAGESFEFPLPPGCVHGRVGTVDHIYTAAEILVNDARGASCDPEAKMLIIGYDVSGGYIYLSLKDERTGVYFRAPYVSGEYFCVSESFAEFVSTLERVSDE
jgi:SMI1-KNR4 cell-wall